MKNPHLFIFSPGVWQGEGTISFSMAEDVFHFRTRWTVLPEEDQKIYFNQEIQIDHLEEKMRNHFCLWELSDSAFELVLENQVVGKVMGSGLITQESIAWEFRRKDQEFEGYEIYEMQRDGTYKMRAEFTAGEGLNTHIEGVLRK